MGQKAKFGIKKREKGINVTPFVDVLLVVLVIFILTSNASIPGIEVNLPKASNSVALEKPKTKAITIDPSGQVGAGPAAAAGAGPGRAGHRQGTGLRHDGPSTPSTGARHARPLVAGDRRAGAGRAVGARHRGAVVAVQGHRQYPQAGGAAADAGAAAASATAPATAGNAA
ncbi:hypothetical protein G6F22_016841 [Rhizopus arrhizus]|nr:hypothetical protein G6F22_016841 [Rhizopus arrhizus]